MMSSLREKVSNAPNAAGVYLFKDNKRRIIYIGKAANLKNRLISYISSETRRDEVLVSNVAAIDYIITNSDVEALTLEESLIKLHKPKYNVRLKDDKKFPYLKITTQEDYPRLLFTRDLTPDGALVFGPYTNAKALRQTRDALYRIFKLVSCTKNLDKIYPRPCLEHYLGRCSAPCTRQIDKESYQNLVKKAIEFLKGNTSELEKVLENEMWRFAKKEQFEAAAALRNQLLAIRKISQRQISVAKDDTNRDCIGIVHTQRSCLACVFKIRENRLIAKEIYQLKISSQVSDEEITSAFVRLIYTHVSFPPAEIVVRKSPIDWDIQSRWFGQRGFKVDLCLGKKGESRRLLEWAEKNAQDEFSKRISKKRLPGAIIELQNNLNLKKAPRWIEAFDVSNLKDKFAVGSSVAFWDGKPSKERYRRYKIKRVRGQNDFAMINEIVARRITDLRKTKTVPDLLLIDGGKGQLSAALTAIKNAPSDIPIFALAKRTDELFDQQGRVVTISGVSKSLFLLKRMRDEAHRFAIGYHRKLRDKSITFSGLDRIAGIGNLRKIALLKYFGSIEAIKKASVDEIAKVKHIGRKIAYLIYESLHA